MTEKLQEKIRESVAAVLPITAIVLVLCITIAPVSSGVMMLFIFGALMLILGMGLFTLGAEVAMIPIGELVGAHITKKKNVKLIVVIGFIIGVMITAAEPDLQVLAHQVASIPSPLLIMTVAVGVGVFLVIALLRILLKIRLSYLLFGFYLLTFGLACFIPGDFLAVAFDSGGVTTGPMTVPFILALGIGVSAVSRTGDTDSDSFGLVAICSIGPILAVMILGLIYQAESSDYTAVVIQDIGNTVELWSYFWKAFPLYAKEVAVALGPIAAFFCIYQFMALKLPKTQLIRIGVGLVYTFIGLVLFLVGVNVGFMPAGNYIGQQIASLEHSWIIIPIAMVIGYFIVNAEPAVHVLTKQVEEITEGSIPQKAILLSLSVGMSLALALAMIRVLTGISLLWILVPGYLIALGLTFFTPKIFTSIAFDSGGVASGPMTATFLLAFTIGACNAVGGNVITDAFGVVALVALTPLVTIQSLGLLYKIRQRRTEEDLEMLAPPDADIVEIIEWENHAEEGGDSNAED
ncbi:MAG: DUF1538 domain-containing protein [Peptococcaceae bacterium]|nr:DUF1538 domain-containing protein [Peptococcaceae bacterium]